MTNSIAVGLAIVIVIALGLDFGLTGGAGSLFLAKEILRLIHWMAFWR
ncbi:MULTISPECIES: glyceraldehyde-3-phosphate dehydrogenase [Celeribacter]|nr:glyceraldehyde-3-phosphate dehydrogenase [Celeribacter naphthalenivorans]